jgi:hypothetical protein
VKSKAEKTMKTKINIITSLVIVLVVVNTFSGCKKSETPSGSEVNTKILSSHGWMLGSLQVDNVDMTSLYTGMTLSFTTGQYTTTKGSPVWASSGTWIFSSDDGKTIVCDNNVQVSVDKISADELVLSLTWSKNTFGSGRESSISGNHVFTFVK